MKDALGHGSDAKGLARKTEAEKNDEFKQLLRGWFTGDKNAGQVLADRYGSKSVAVEIHRGQTMPPPPPGVTMVSLSSPAAVHNAVAKAVAEHDTEYNRDLALRIKNRQVGSGMKFRG